MAEEWLVRVDEQDRPLEAVARSRFPFGEQIHRSTFIFVLNDRDELCVQTRTASKGYCPGLRDLAAGGVVAWGEDYLESARRELYEELGIRAELVALGRFLHRSPGNWAHGAAYLCRHQGPLTLQPSEVAAVQWLPLDQVLASPGPAFTPDSLDAFHRFLLPGR
ncbi:NUDIX domain-containing protein [Gallaecimonas sp. GXIMD4217]|uniref:NUDIX hydrolase n=1 Tax=Gallaecimonas sp. GXIMD4217 TaxID=3131927 RepID=UPI00311ABC9D